MAVDVERVKQRLTALEGDRTQHEGVWKDCFDYSMPHLGSGFWNSSSLSASEIQQRKARLLNGTAGEAMTTSADGFMGGMTPANALWFGLDTGRETDEEKAWLADSAYTIWENLHASNFDAEAYDAVLNLLGAGWFVLYVEEAKDGGYHCENWALWQCYIAASKPGARVDTIYRKFQLPAGTVVDDYGRDKVSERVRQLVDSGKSDTLVDILWAIEPRRDYLPGAQVAERMPFSSVHIDLATNTVLRESGYQEFPCVVPRWRRIPGSVYAVGPMSDALPDAKSANEVERWEFAAAETAIAPPMVAVDDGVLNARGIKLGPRKIIVANSVDSIKPLLTGANVQFGQIMLEKLELKIRRALMADLFDKVLNDPTMTATQVHAIVGMIRQRMGPRFGRQQAEWLQPLIDRCFGIALRAGVLGQPPQSLINRNYTIKYESPLARAQKLDDVAAMDRYEQSLGAEAAIKPDVIDNYDWDKGARRRAELLGVPQDLLPAPKAIAQQREARAEAAQQAQQQQVQMAAQQRGAEVMAEQLAGA